MQWQLAVLVRVYMDARHVWEVTMDDLTNHVICCLINDQVKKQHILYPPVLPT